jgi:hypothetical protein
VKLKKKERRGRIKERETCEENKKGKGEVFMGKAKVFNPSEGGKVGSRESLELHMFIDFQYLFLGDSVGLEIWHRFGTDALAKKNS